ncbi:helix-turn-helix transcriptional regulator [bacterium]|nr:helix-turn-helix transcriptional regulator [bacterium]
MTLKAKKPPPKGYPQNPKTLGDHLRKKRLDLGLLQKDVAKILGVSKDTVCNWENNRTSPSLRSIPKIIEFLGYIPYDIQGLSPGEELRLLRRALGLSQERLAKELGIDPSTLWRWEKGKRGTPEQILVAIRNRLDDKLYRGNNWGV